MPCRHDISNCVDGYLVQHRAQEKNDTLSEMLCSACRVLEAQKFDFDLNPMLSKWWDAHKREDARKEALRVSNKLRGVKWH